MAECSLAVEQGGVAHAHLPADGFLKRHEFFVGDSAQETLQEDDSLSETCVQIVVDDIHCFPVGNGIHGSAAGQFIGRDMEVAPKIHNHFKQGADFVEELGPLG